MKPYSLAFIVVCGFCLSAAVSLAAEREKPPLFRFEKAEGKYLHLLEGEKPVLTYNYGMLLGKGVPEDRRRSSYIHPVYGLDGEVLSDDFPADHLHHRGLCWVWPRVIVGGKEYDLWSLQGVEQKFERWLGEKAGRGFAAFGVANGWYVGEKKIVKETVRVRVFPAGEKGRAIDVKLTLEAAEEPVTISGRSPVKGYGGFSFRFAPRKETVLTSPAGREVADSNLKRFPWVDLSAKFGGKDFFSGVAIFDDSRNPGFPNGWTLRDYGFLGVAWPGLKLYILKPGEPLTIRYRVWIHRGGAKEGDVAAAYAAYASTGGRRGERTGR
ncbi:PmoA family protein [bacterium]|nr:PmoA family protein [bacterium]